jgi:hypothetical protein
MLGIIFHANICSKSLEFNSSKWLCQEINLLLNRWCILHLDFNEFRSFSYVMMLQFDMFGSCMMYKIDYKFNTRQIVIKKFHWSYL